MQDQVELRKFFNTHRDEQTLVLCTLVRKTGSSYRGLGAKKIVALSGASYGMLSGGCLEASIEKAARERISEMPFISSFSTLADEDRLLGYQTGCQGVIDILFEQMNERELDLLIPFGSPAKAQGVSVTLSGPRFGQREFSNSPSARNISSEEILFENWVEPVNLVIVGCGADADAYLPLAQSLGWTIQFIDYRRDLAFPERFPDENVKHVPLEKIASNIPEGPRVAVILMTHNYEADMEILRGLKNHNVGYLGCLGPAKRFARLQEDLLKFHEEVLPSSLVSKVSAPAGLYTHSRSPSEIALSVVAEIQGKLVEDIEKPHVWSLILAAGASSRFGGPKALAMYEGQTFLSRALSTARSVTSENVLTVTGGHADVIVPALSNHTFTFNQNWQQGMGTSITAGIAGVLENDPATEMILIMPVDQPFIDKNHLQKLRDESLKTGLCTLTITNDGTQGAPAAVPKKFFARAMELKGDRGLKSVLKPHELTFVYSANALRDIDSQEELALL